MRKDGIPSAPQQEMTRFPNAVSLRSAGIRLLRRGHHAEAEILLRAAAAAVDQRDSDVPLDIVEDIARAVLPHSPVEALGLVESLERGESNLGQGLRTSGLNLKGRVLYELFQISKADDYFRKAMVAANRDGNDIYRGYISLNQAIISFDRGEINKAEKSTLKAISRFERRNDLESIMFAKCNLAVHSLVIGDYDTAIDHIEHTSGAVSRVGNPWLLAYHNFICGEIELLTGERDAAIQSLSSSVRQSGLAGNSALQARALALKSLLEDSHKETYMKDLDAVAHDLYSSGLRADSGLILILGAQYAKSRNQDWRGIAAKAFELFEGLPCYDMFTGHYSRIIAASSTHKASRGSRNDVPGFVTRSESVKGILSGVRTLAKTDVRILVEGESGTGKSFLVRLTHEVGGAKRPFVVVDCTNLEENLFESKLFGHMRGAFTGAVSDSVGLVEQADGGTLFLDEIGEMPVEIQAKLLYTIEEQRYRPVGAKMEKTSSFRVIAATNRDIDEMLDEGTLRRDLYFRIAGYRVLLPPLRERREDVVPLAELQLDRLNRKYGRKKSLKPGVWDTLVQYDWPGNVRELNAVLERGFHLATGRRIAEADLGLEPDGEEAADLTWEGVRRAHLLRVLKLCRGNVTQAAKVLGMNRTTLIYKLKQLDIERADYDPAMANEGVAEKPSLQLVADRETERAPEERMDEAE